MGTFVCTYAGQILNEDMANKVGLRDFISFDHKNACMSPVTYKNVNCPYDWIIYKQNKFTLDLLEEKIGLKEDIKEVVTT